MIDHENETLIPLQQIPCFLPPSPRTGRPIHAATIHRWIANGLHGTKLEILKIGAATYTSREALRRFLERTNAAVGVPAA